MYLKLLFAIDLNLSQKYFLDGSFQQVDNLQVQVMQGQPCFQIKYHFLKLELMIDEKKLKTNKEKI